MRLSTLLSKLTHVAIGTVAAAVLLAALFATQLLTYDGTLVWTRPFAFSESTGGTLSSTDEVYIEVSSHAFGFSPVGLAVLALIVAGLLSGVSYALFARRQK